MVVVVEPGCQRRSRLQTLYRDGERRGEFRGEDQGVLSNTRRLEYWMGVWRDESYLFVY
jgi:hypothetical protein